MKWPFGMSDGEWTWRSFTVGDYESMTIVMIQNGKGFQYIFPMEWAHFDGRPEVGRGDAEDFAKLVCAAVNEYLHNHPELRLTK